MMDIKQSEEYKHNGSDMKKTESRADAFQRNEEHATYCYFRTVMLVMPFVTMGITHSIKYTSIPDLRIILNASTQDISFAIAIGTLGGAVGGPLAAFADRFVAHGDLVLAAALFTITVTFALLPFSPVLWVFSCLDTGFNLAWVLYQGAAHGVISSIWGQNGGSARYGIHFGYPIGAAIGPLIAIPFMGDTTDSNDTSNQGFIFSVHKAYSLLEHLTDDVEDVTDDTSIEFAYLIGSGVALILSAIFIFMYIFGPRSAYLYQNTLSENKYSWKEVISPRVWTNGDFAFGIKIMILMFIYYLFVVAAIMGTQIYIVTYAVDSDLGFSSQEAATLNSVISIMGTLARGIAIVAIKYIHITHMIVLETHGLLLFGILCLFVGTEYKIALWIIAPCLGFFRELLWPAGFAWTENFMVLFGVLVGLNDLVNGITNFFVISIQGYLYENVSIETIFYTTVGYGACLCILVHIMNFIGNKHGNRKNIFKDNLETKVEEITRL